VTSGGMVVTVASLASVGGRPNGRPPRQIVVEVFASLAVQPGRVVLTLALTVNHVLSEHLLIIERNAPRCVTVARARAPNHHVVDGVVILLLNFVSRIQKIVSQIVEAGEIDSQVGHLE